jgi:hypothetical protein
LGAAINGKSTARESRAGWLNHPQGCLGYRIETSGGSIVYATDNEPGVPELDQNLRQLAQGADVLIYDAQYSPEQLASDRRGWGHSSWLEGVKIARETKARNLVLFHHDPDSTDKNVDGFLSAARQEFQPTWAATEGMSITLSERGVDVAMRESRLGQRRRLRFVGHGQRDNRKTAATFEEKGDGARPEPAGCLPLLEEPAAAAIGSARGDRGRRRPQHVRACSHLRGTVVHCDAWPRAQPERRGHLSLSKIPIPARATKGKKRRMVNRGLRVWRFADRDRRGRD